jgi:hypothetical protein
MRVVTFGRDENVAPKALETPKPRTYGQHPPYPHLKRHKEPMLLFRWLILFAAVVSLHVLCRNPDGEARFKRYGLTILKWTLIAPFGFCSADS